MADSSVLLLLHQIIEDAVLLIQISVNVHLADIVEQVKIKIRDPALFKLLLKDLLHLRHICKIIARKLRSQIELVPGISTQNLPHHKLRIPPVISPCRVIIVDPAAHGVFHHLGRRRLVNVLILAVDQRKAHCPHTKCGQLQILKFPVNHTRNLLLYPLHPEVHSSI